MEALQNTGTHIEASDGVDANEFCQDIVKDSFEKGLKLSENIEQPGQSKILNQESTDKENDDEAVLLDFTNDFKKNVKRKPLIAKKAQNNKTIEVDDANKDLEDQNLTCAYATEIVEIPRNLNITQEEMAKRKCMDQRRWFCLTRPQYPKSCGISSLTSCWNYLYSTLGVGQHRPISTEEALEVLGFTPPYNDVKFGSFTGNETLILWFNLLNKFFHQKGKAQVAWKLHGKNKTLGIDKDQALTNLTTGLRSTTKAYIYHCWNHYFCPIGFEQTPTKPMDAYKNNNEICEFDTWIIIGEVSKCYPVFHVKKWEDIVTDISTAFPQFYNIRKPELGVQTKQSKAFTEGGKLGGNLHCIIEFESL